MVKRVSRLSILQTAKLLAVIYGFFAVWFVPVTFMLTALNENGSGVGFGVFFLLVLYPVMGFVGGLIGAVIYNLAAKMVGGLELTLDHVEHTESCM